MIRSILAVLVGFLVMAVSIAVVTALVVWAMFGEVTEVPTPTSTYLVLNLSYSFLLAALGGFVTASIAPRSRGKHVMVLAGLFLFMAGLSAIQGPQPGQPAWYPIVILAIGLAGVLSGGWVRQRKP